ncbi:MAG: bifunctional methylenetetrahydrofolate dehydrogenase/ methenyltetrahydrofolate cyclohydrolase [Candidatus Desulfovibrio kirbyi]|uniref:Bifunctional protein FolD n=1 Tax=Candidatus Desulfovibrio kirbyi TaxID=2696086 RepID=A0A6L2R4S0_9BACT|nr:MAG: bifunctional methylenetetrahydrofolate dehydrogenase/ methenyltetrahydrofolate cyclohydrolase [Candidatus Desulfovibrio kirbyi]
MILLNGKETAQGILRELSASVASAGCRPPGLAVILAGEDPASQIYVRAKERACGEVGIVPVSFTLPAATPQSELLALIRDCNTRQDIDGILLQLPLPLGIEPETCLLAIDPGKDVDGFHPENVGRCSLGLPGFMPCTPAGVLELLRRYQLSPSGKKAVVVGRSNIVGKPLASLLYRQGVDATVTICHSKTQGLARECCEADFLFVAMGRPEIITADMVKEGVVVVDIGISRTADGLRGDVDFASVSLKARAITPVPGGAGPMTIAMLMQNTVQAWKKRMNI